MRGLRARLRRGERAQLILIVALGNPGRRYEGTRHNVGFAVAERLARRWGLPAPKRRFGGLYAAGPAGELRSRAALLWPQTYMNESGAAAGAARGALRVPLERLIVIHDEIDLPFGEVRVRLGGGLAGHNGLKSLARGVGGPGFWRVRIGVGRPDSSDPELVSRYVLSRFAEPADQVSALLERAGAEVERLLGELG